uniref:HMA domain-containing protein n=1 Tax=Quercus lobata TaxID=97700 RepID=A0A7N2M8N3_QUELO
MKQKIVIKVQMNCDKCTRMAMKIACRASGVNSVAIEGSDRDQLVVIGEGVDSANLTCSLRKKLCYAALLSVEEVKAKPKPEEKPKPKPEEKPVQKPNKHPSSTCSCGCPQLPMCPQYPPYPMLYEAKVYDYTPSPSYCPIM